MPSGVYKRTKRWKLSEETKKKMSEAHKGKVGTFMGHKHTEETKRRMSEAHKGMKKPWSNPPHYLGKKNPNWKGGITLIRIAIRKLKKYKDWCKETYALNNFKCQKCFRTGKKLEAHHIKNFATILRENKIRDTQGAIKCFELWKKGITLCKDCHLEFHKKYGRKNNTKEQLEEFIKILK